MTRVFACLAVAAFLAACQSSPAPSGANLATPQSVTIQPGDVPGMQRCDTSGDVAAVLNQEKSQGSHGYDMHATEWEQWKRQGAVDAYFAVYGHTAADCAAASGTTTGAPTGGLMVGLVVQFKDTNGAARNFSRESTLMGLGPKDIRFIELAGGTTTFGSATGLGDDSVIGSAVVAGSAYFVAMWQNGRFESDFMGYDTGFTESDNAVLAMNKRIIPA